MKLKLTTFFGKQYLLLFVVVIIGVFLRTQAFATQTFAYTYDVGRDMLALWNIAYIHKIPLIGATTGLPGVFYGPWWYFLLTPFFIIFQGDPRGIDLVMSGFGIATIILAFILGRKVGNNFLGLAFAALISVSPVMISLASQIWNPNIAPFFVLLTLYVLFKIYSFTGKSSIKYYFFLGFLLALNMDLEIVFGALLSLGVIASVIVIINKNLKVKSFIAFVLGAFVILSPRIFFEVRHSFLMTKALLAFLGSSNSSHSSANIVEVFVNRVAIIFESFKSTVAIDNVALALLLVLIMGFLIVYFYKKMEKTLKSLLLTSLIIVLFFAIGLTFFKHDIWPHYFVGVPVVYIFILSVSIYLLNKYASWKLLSVGFLLIMFLLNLNPVNLINNITNPGVDKDVSVYKNQVATVDYAYKNAAGKDFKYVVYTPPLHDYTYQYLFMWYGVNKYHYAYDPNSRLAFFILEPDYEDPSRLTTWLKQRAGDGKIIKTETLKGNIIIQTRVH